MSESLAGKQFDVLYSSEVSTPILEPWRTSSGSAVQFPYPCMQTSITRMSGEVSKTEQFKFPTHFLSVSDVPQDLLPQVQ